VGRPTTWTEPQLFAALVPLFHRKGFAQTSLKDIEQATGLHPGSIYKAYGSKEALFKAAVRAYNELVVARRVRTFLHEAADPLAGIRQFFTSTLDAPDDPNPGCLLTNTAIESFSLDPGIRPAVAAGLEHIESGLRHALERTAGQPAPSTPVDDTAAQLLALYEGVLVLIRFGTPRAKVAAVIDQALPALTQAHTATTRKANRP
jgi:TetR/AcrR family transcriptional repressor of nem operon